MAISNSQLTDIFFLFNKLTIHYLTMRKLTII